MFGASVAVITANRFVKRMPKPLFFFITKFEIPCGKHFQHTFKLQ